MVDFAKIEQQVESMQKQAYKVISDLKIVETWGKIGAKVNLVGSLRMGLLVKHKDIDFHIYTEELNPSLAFSVIKKFEKSSKVKKVEFADLSEEDDCCLEFHIWVEDENSGIWQIDMINIKAGSKYDGHFERLADKIVEEMTPKQKETIWSLKYQTPDTEKISGMEYYKAVIQDNVRTFEELLAWRKTHRFSGIIEW